MRSLRLAAGGRLGTRGRTECTGTRPGSAPGRRTGTLPGPWRSTPEPPWWSAWARSPRRPTPGSTPPSQARAAGAHDGGAAGGGGGLRRRAGRRGGPGRARPARAGRQHPGRGLAGLAHPEPGPAGGGAPRLRRGRRARRADGLVHRRQQPPGPHARRLPRHQPGRARRRAGHRAPRPCTPAPWPAGTRPGPGWTGPASPRARRRPRSSGWRRPGATELEMQRGVVLPVHAYPLFENALRAANGWTLPEHRARIGGAVVALQRGGRRQPARVDPHGPDTRRDRHARARPTGWCRSPTPSSARPTCRSTRARPSSCARSAAARAAGVPEERWVFPLAGADANDHWFISERPELHRSPAIRLAGAAALERAGLRHRRHRLRRPLLVLPRRGADGGGRARASPSTIRTGR